MNNYCELKRKNFRPCILARAKPIFLIFAGALWLGALAVRAADYYVRPPGTTATDASPYNSWETAATQIQWAVNVAMSNIPATVWVTNGNYCLTNQIAITNNITVRSVNGWTNTIVYADWPTYTTRCFYVANTGIVDGFTITNGHVMDIYNGIGGGAYIARGGLMQNCRFANNYASNSLPSRDAIGGGAFIEIGVVSNCDFYSNTYYYGASAYGSGGGLCIETGSVLNCRFISNSPAAGSGSVLGDGIGMLTNSDQVVISNCLVANHWQSSGAGEGIFPIGGSRIMIVDCVFSNDNQGAYSEAGLFKNCVFRNNNQQGVRCHWGGAFTNCIFINNLYGIYVDAGTTVLVPFDHCTITSNTRWGVYSPGGVVLMRNCLIGWNRCDQVPGGGGLYLSNSARLFPGVSGIFNCTIASNSTTKDGGGIYLDGGTNNIVNCVIASNRATGGVYQDICNTNYPVNTNNYYNSICNDTNTGLFALSQGNITNDPRFIDPSGGNWRLANNSPAINTGTNQSWMTNAFDFDGRTRTRYGRVDMGAYEAIYDGTMFMVP